MATNINQWEFTTEAVARPLAGGGNYVLLTATLLFLALLFTNVPQGFEYENTGDTTGLLEGSWLRRFQWMPLFLAALYVLWRRRALLWPFLFRVNPFLIALVGFMLLSAIWSPLPLVTIRRVVFMSGVFMIGVAVLLAGWYPRRLIRLFYVSVGLMVLASAISAMFVPGFGVHTTGAFTGLWHGICGDKNLMANLSGLGVLLGAHALLTQPTRRLLNAGYLMLSVLVLIMTGAKGSLVATCLAAFLMAMLVLQPVTNRYWLPVVSIIAVFMALIPLHFYIMFHGVPTYADLFGPFFELLGKDLSISGRDDIWVWLLPIIGDHWLLGIGYGAFWVGDYGLSGEITQTLGYYPFQAHNTFLEMLNELGVVGLMLLVGFLLHHIAQLLKLRQIDHASYCLYLPIVALILAISTSETALFGGGGTFTMILVFSSFATTRALMAAERSS